MLGILIADDHEVVRRGLKELLRDEFGEIEVSEADDYPKLLELVRARRWNLILLDIVMPGMKVVEALARIRETDAGVPVLVLTAVSEAQYAVRTLKAGANGYITKQRAAEELIQAVRKLLAGESFVSSDAVAALADGIRQGDQAAPHESLSRRELQVLCLIAKGKAVKEIAYELSLSAKTVGTYVARIKEKTGLDKPADIARYALRHKLIDP